MHLQENTLYNVTYTPAKFEVATSNGLGRDTCTRNLMDRQLWFEIIIPTYKKGGIIRLDNSELSSA